MLIDWLTMRLPECFLSREQWLKLQSIGDRVTRHSGSTGEVIWQTFAWDSVRSDSHQVAVKLGSDAFHIQGSPARVMGCGCSVFGSSYSSELDLPGSAQTMIEHVNKALGLDLPGFMSWRVTRVDVTANLLLGSLQEVRDALKIMRNCEGGRYRVSQQAGDTVYWSHRSRRRKGKAYAKGPHLVYQSKKNVDLKYTKWQIDQAQRLLRLELTLGAMWFRENAEQWFDLTGHQLKKAWESFFLRMIGGLEMTNDHILKQAVMDNALSPGRGQAAYGCWLLIKSEGWERARESFTRPTWYRHLQTLRAAGLSDTDLSSGVIVPLRRKILNAQIIHDWADIEAVNAA